MYDVVKFLQSIHVKCSETLNMQIGMRSLNDYVRCVTINFYRILNKGIKFSVVQLVFKRIRKYKVFIK